MSLRVEHCAVLLQVVSAHFTRRSKQLATPLDWAVEKYKVLVEKAVDLIGIKVREIGLTLVAVETWLGVSFFRLGREILPLVIVITPVTNRLVQKVIPRILQVSGWITFLTVEQGRPDRPVFGL